MKFPETLLLLAYGGTILGAGLMLKRRLTKGRLSNSFYYSAWLIVLLRFALPIEGMITPIKLPEPPRERIEQAAPVPTPQA